MRAVLGYLASATSSAPSSGDAGRWADIARSSSGLGRRPDHTVAVVGLNGIGRDRAAAAPAWRRPGLDRSRVSSAETCACSVSCPFAGHTLGTVRLRHPLRRTSTCSKLEGGGDGGARVVKQRGPQRLRSVDLSPSWVWPPSPDGAMQQLIVRLARENPAGYQRIKGELLRLHVRVSASAIRETLRR